jgi:hypothetical protein
MKELYDYRTRLIDTLVAAANEFRAKCLAVPDPFVPLEEGGWNTHQVAAHTRDVDAHSATHYDAKEPLDSILNGLVESVGSLAEMLRGLSGEAWARESRHSTLGSGFTLQTWVERNLAHIEEHIATVIRGTK